MRNMYPLDTAVRLDSLKMIMPSYLIEFMKIEFLTLHWIIHCIRLNIVALYNDG